MKANKHDLCRDELKGLVGKVNFSAISREPTLTWDSIRAEQQLSVVGRSLIDLPFLSVHILGESDTIRKMKINMGFYKSLKSNIVCINNPLCSAMPSFG